MQSPKIRSSVVILGMFLAAIGFYGVLSTHRALGTSSKQNPSPTWTAPIYDYYAPFYVNSFLVETNLDSSQPLVVHVYGGLSDSCTRIRYGLVHYRKSEIRISLYMGIHYQGAACTQMVVPQTVSVPIDVAALPVGDYTIDVAGQMQIVTITPEMQAVASVYNTEPTGIVIDKIEYVPTANTLGQPAVKIYGGYTIDCPYLIGIIQHTLGHQITFIPKVTGTCESQYLPEPIPLIIPLDLADLPLGEYTLTVGDKSLKFDLDAAPTPPRSFPADWMPPITEPPTDSLWLPVY